MGAGGGYSPAEPPQALAEAVVLLSPNAKAPRRGSGAEDRAALPNACPAAPEPEEPPPKAKLPPPPPANPGAVDAPETLALFAPVAAGVPKPDVVPLAAAPRENPGAGVLAAPGAGVLAAPVAALPVPPDAPNEKPPPAAGAPAPLELLSPPKERAAAEEGGATLEANPVDAAADDPVAQPLLPSSGASALLLPPPNEKPPPGACIAVEVFVFAAGAVGALVLPGVDTPKLNAACVRVLPLVAPEQLEPNEKPPVVCSCSCVCIHMYVL